MYDLNGKVALVTGTAKKRGIGRQIALRLAREGADLIVSDKSGEAFAGLDAWEKDEGWLGLPSLVAEIRAMGRRALAIPADLSSSLDINSLVTEAVEELGKVDILVNNAAMVSKDIGPDGPLVDLPEEIWHKSIAVNLTGVFLVCKAVVKNMIERGQGGRIINTSSLAGKQGLAGKGAYSAAKFGVIGITQVLAAEPARYNITVNAICPGSTVSWGTMGQAIYEGIKQGLSEDEAIARAYVDITQSVPLGRPGTVEDTANLVAFLASDQSAYITGQAINVNGGRLVAP